jgi:L-aspartate oxidase
VSARVTADYLVIGSGIAGLRAAVELVAHGRVLVLTKADPTAGSTGDAQGGIAAAVGDDDSPSRHADDTIPQVTPATPVRSVVEDGRRYVVSSSNGSRFRSGTRRQAGAGPRGAHWFGVLHARDATARNRPRAFGGCAAPNLLVVDHALVVQLIVEAGTIAGARFLDVEGRPQEARRPTQLASVAAPARSIAKRTLQSPPERRGARVSGGGATCRSSFSFIQRR